MMVELHIIVSAQWLISAWIETSAFFQCKRVAAKSLHLGGGSSLWRDQSQGRKQLCALGIWKAFMFSTPFPTSCWIAAALHSASILNAFSIDSDITDSCFKRNKSWKMTYFHNSVIGTCKVRGGKHLFSIWNNTEEKACKHTTFL